MGTNVQRTHKAEIKSQKLSELTDIKLPIKFFPDEEDSQNTYLRILEQMELPGCVIVAVPDHLHFYITSACLEKGLHTLVVKPLTPSVKEAKDLIRLAKKRIFMVPLNFTNAGIGKIEFWTIYFSKVNLECLYTLGRNTVRENPCLMRFSELGSIKSIFYNTLVFTILTSTASSVGP